MKSNKKDEMDQNMLENDVQYIDNQVFGKVNYKSENHLVANLNTRKEDSTSQ